TSVPRSASTVSGGKQVYSATLNTGDNAFRLFVNANPYSIQARYNQNSGKFPSLVSNSQNLSISLQGSSTNLSINPSQATFTFGDRIDISALTTPAITGSIIPFAAGNLRFDDNAVLLNGPNATLTGANPFSIFSTTSLSVGSHSLTASYSGDGANYAASTSSAINLTVKQALTTTAFTSVPSPAIVNLGSSITFNIAVATPAINAPQKPTGSITFSGPNNFSVIRPLVNGTASLIFTPTVVGMQTITATYSGDMNYLGSNDPLNTLPQSNTLIVTVPSLTLDPISATPVQRGASVTLTATMDPADNNVNQPGSVDFFYGSTPITSVPRSASTVSGGKQVYSATINTGDNAFSLFVNANPYSIQARYNQNGGNFPTVTSGVQTLTVITQNTTTSVASPLFPLQASGSLVYGNRFDLSAALAPAIPGSIIPFASQATGIRILDNGVVIATLPISNDSRSPVFSKTDFAVGTHVLTAQFIGDGNYAMSTSQPFTLTVTPASTSINLTSAADYLALGQTFTLNASIFSNAQTMPTQISGVVNFTATGPGGSITNLPAGAISIGKASSTFTPTLPGKYTITANYLGDANYQASSATRSLTAASISIEVTDANGAQTISTAPRGSSVTLTARLTPADSSAIDTLTGLPVQPGSVSFRLSNGTVITAVARQDSNSINGSQVYSATINTGNNLFSLPVGVATISARYNANGGLYPQVDSATPAILTVTRQATTTALSTPSVTSIPYGSAVSFSAAVAPVIAATGADAIPFGTSQIQFFNASALIQTSAVNDGNRSSTLSLELLPVGSYLISARYAGDNANYLASRSTDSTPAFALGVTQASTNITLSLSSQAIDSGSSVLLTATVGSGATGNALRPSGTVNFFNNGTLIGSGIVNPATGVVQFSYRPPTVGGYSLSASYAGDANYSGSSSAASSSLVVNTFQPFYAIAMQGGSKFATFNTRTNALIATYQPNGPRYTGGFTLARGDVNGDGVADLLWATNRGSFVRIIDGLTSHDLGGFFGFNSNFNSPISIAVGDINKDGKGDIMVAAAGRNAGGVVRVYSGASFGQLLYQGSPYGERFGGGISLASGDVDGDGWADIISSPLSAGVARVVVVSGKTQSTIRNFLAQTPGYTGGISVAAADLNNDGLAEIITATNSGRGIVSVFDGSAPFNSGVQAPALGQLVIGGPRFTGGARVAVVSDINGDGIPDLLTTMGPGGGAGATRYSFNATTRNFQLIDSLFAFSSGEPGANNGLRPA
ncbi:MAG: Ig-like domain repeat protein, partial [Planctomycetes bacterium]|nr:Ig-like domain repeat protein [Planctomycetota bacterium]